MKPNSDVLLCFVESANMESRIIVCKALRLLMKQARISGGVVDAKCGRSVFSSLRAAVTQTARLGLHITRMNQTCNSIVQRRPVKCQLMSFFRSTVRNSVYDDALCRLMSPTTTKTTQFAHLLQAFGSAASWKLEANTTDRQGIQN
jgi:hypothetical protein